MLEWTIHEKITLVKKKKNDRDLGQVHCNYMLLEKWAFYWEKHDIGAREISKV